MLILGGPLRTWPGLSAVRSGYEDIPTMGWKEMSAAERRKQWTPCGLLIAACVIVFGFFGAREAALGEYRSAWEWVGNKLGRGKVARRVKVKPQPLDVKGSIDVSENEQ